MSNRSLEQRVTILEARVRSIEGRMQAVPALRVSWIDSDRPPMTPEELEIHEEVRRYVREAREIELAEFDRELERERAMEPDKKDESL